MLLVFGYLPLKDRVYLAQTCRRLQHLAINEGALGCPEHVISSHAAGRVALFRRARNLKVTSKSAFQTFVCAYSWLVQPKWPIVRIVLCTEEDSDLLGENLGVLLPSLVTLSITTYDEPLRLDSPALVAGLTSCTELLLEGFKNTDDEELAKISVAPSVLAALPKLRKFTWCGPAFTSDAPGPTISPFQPLMGNLVSVTHNFHPGAKGKDFLSQLHPHVPNFRHLALEWMEDETIPSAVFDLVCLESLEFKCCEFEHIPHGIGRLTRLTRLSCRGCNSVVSVSPAIGSLSRLRSLVVIATLLIRIPAEALDFTRLTELNISYAHGITSFPDFSRLHGLKVLNLSKTGIDIADVLRSEHDLPQLEHLSFGSRHTPHHRAVPLSVFRPQLRTVNMNYIRGPLPGNMGCMVSLTKLVILDSQDLSALPGGLRELLSLEVLDIWRCGLVALPPSIAALSRLRTLRVRCNKLQSCPSLGALRQLRTLDLGENFLTYLPEGIQDLPSLETVSITFNCMYRLEWDVLKRLPLLGSCPMPNTYNPSSMRLMSALTMRSRSGDNFEYPTIV